MRGVIEVRGVYVGRYRLPLRVQKSPKTWLLNFDPVVCQLLLQILDNLWREIRDLLKVNFGNIY